MIDIKITVDEIKAYNEFGLLHEIGHCLIEDTSCSIFYRWLLDIASNANDLLLIPLYMMISLVGLINNFKNRSIEYKADSYVSGYMHLDKIKMAFKFMKMSSNTDILGAHPCASQRMRRLQVLFNT